MSPDGMLQVVRLGRGVYQSDPSPPPATTSMLAKITAPPPAPKPPARLLVVRLWSLIFPPQLTQFMSLAKILQVVQRGRGVWQSTPSSPQVITSTSQRVLAAPPAPKPPARLLVVRLWSLIFPPQPTQFMSLAKMLQVVRLGQGVGQSTPSPPQVITSMLGDLTMPPPVPKLQARLSVVS